MIFRLLSVFSISFILLLGGCGKGGDSSSIRVGLIAELSGELPAVGASSKNAALMAVEDVNKDGGVEMSGKRIPIKLIIEDNASKADQSAAAAQKLITQEDVVAFVGPNASLGAIPASEIAEGAHVLMITPWSTNPKTSLDARSGQAKKYVFRACFTDPFEGRVLARFALEHLKVKTAAALYDVSSEAPKSQSELFKKIFEEQGGKIVSFETYTTGDKDFSAQLTKILAQKPDLIFLPAYYNDVPLVVQQAQRLGLKVPFLGSDAWSSPDLIKLSGGAVEGNYFCNHYAVDDASPKAVKFIEAYKAKYGKAPDDVAALTYDAFGLLFQALKDSGKIERQSVRDAMARITGYDGVTGSMRFENGSGDPVKSAVILQIKDGRFVWVMNAKP